MHAQLSQEHRAILEFEHQHWRHPGTKTAAIRDRFNITPTRYHQRLMWLIDQPAAEAAYPMLVRRLRRLRDQRRHSAHLMQQV